MAETIGYKSADMVYKIERDATEPSWEQADKWAQACGKLIGDILPNSGGGHLDPVLQPLLAAFAGLSRDDLAALVLNLSSQARLMATWRHRPEQPQPQMLLAPAISASHNAASVLSDTAQSGRGVVPRIYGVGVESDRHAHAHAPRESTPPAVVASSATSKARQRKAR